MKLEEHYFTTLEQLQVWHKLDESSPLWKMRDSLTDHLDGVEVSVLAFDTATLQNVMMFYRYEKKDLVLSAVFENTLSPSGNKQNIKQLQADHSKLDNFMSEDDGTRLGSRKRKNSLPKPLSRSISSREGTAERRPERSRSRKISQFCLSRSHTAPLASHQRQARFEVSEDIRPQQV